MYGAADSTPSQLPAYAGTQAADVTHGKNRVPLEAMPGDPRKVAEAVICIGDPRGRRGASSPVPTPTAWAEAAIGSVSVLVNGVARAIVGTFLGTRAAVPSMRRRGGSIVNINSTAGIGAAGGLVVYGTSKWGICRSGLW
ncbi:SDR family NAD(P)-dependent oxidoreductase [Streptomyces sp. NPDC020794]|uniref:SDR family NAD(P)-dependent oxidoreductase n=1 Tax=unclassified Streptomyces TaxID=2593676 RepID=UPI0036E53633